MEPEGSLPHSHVPDTCSYPEPPRSSPFPTSQFLKIRFNIILPSTSDSPNWFFNLRFSNQDPIYVPPLPIRATCTAHLILFYFINRKILGEEYRSLSMKQGIKCLRTSIKLMIQLGGKSCLIEFGIHMKLVRPIKTSLNETYSRVWVGKNLSNMFSIKNGLNQEDTYRHFFSTLL